MNGFIPRILIADNNYIIGLEAQRIILEARACTVEIRRRDDLAQALSTSFDLVFVDAAPAHEAQVRQAEIVHAAGAGLVFMHTGQMIDSERFDCDILAIFEKPFYEPDIHDFMAGLHFSSDTIP